ncbi:STAS domain-containing protein [Aliikangiella marina]|uniref:STAS domain-containing protein n=1 Tax=Aliikangiella marina TaxID=1712262 RepID=A0A545T553_9GAMM|nr:STAS domain-containing protein [Aliikangiella marina]TQV72302.1 STAS domain-containing protein [Aliikangiella marina]
MKLPKNCTVESIETIHANISKLMEEEILVMNAKDVEKFDISFVQLLLALEKTGKSFTFAEPSDGLTEYLKLYRLEKYLA